MPHKKVSLDDLHKKIAIDHASGCWNWTSQINRTGYAIGRYEGKTQLIHRVFYRNYKGHLSDGSPLDHLCRNRACVNPSHLESVSIAENSRRGANAVLTRDQVIEIRKQYANTGTTQKRLASVYGVSLMTINDIVIGRTWNTEMDLSDLSKANRHRTKQANTKISEKDRKEICERFAAGGITKSALSKEYGIHPSHMGRIINSQNEVENVNDNETAITPTIAGEWNGSQANVAG